MVYKCSECGKELNEEDGEVFRHERQLDSNGRAVILCEEHYNEYEIRDAEEKKNITEKITGYANDIIIIQKCNRCGRFETTEELRARYIQEGEEAEWVEGVVESGLNTEERIEARGILNEAFSKEVFEATEDNAEEQNWDVCYNICPDCKDKREDD